MHRRACLSHVEVCLCIYGPGFICDAEPSVRHCSYIQVAFDHFWCGKLPNPIVSISRSFSRFFVSHHMLHVLPDEFFDSILFFIHVMMYETYTFSRLFQFFQTRGIDGIGTSLPALAGFFSCIRASLRIATPVLCVYSMVDRSERSVKWDGALEEYHWRALRASWPASCRMGQRINGWVGSEPQKIMLRRTTNFMARRPDRIIDSHFE